MMTGPDVAWYWNAIFSLPLALGFAAASWHAVEAPCLRLKTRLRSSAARPRAPAPEAPSSTGA